MNFREGVRRAFVVLGVITGMIGLALYVYTHQPEVEYEGWAAVMRTSVQADFDPSGDFQILQDGRFAPEQFIHKECSSKNLHLRKHVAETCDAIQAEQHDAYATWAKNVLVGLILAAALFCAVFLAWRVLDWILAGFSRQQT